MSQTESNDVKPSLEEITRETPASAIDIKFEETTVQRLGDVVLLQFYRQDDVRMHEVMFKPTPSFCADIDRLFETINIAVSQQDPDIRFKMEERTDGVQLHLLVTLRTTLGIDQRRLTVQVSVVNEERSMWHRMSKEVRTLREKNAALESRLEHLETTAVVFAVGKQSQSQQCSTQLVCDTLYLSIESNITYFGDVMDNVRAKTVHLVQHGAPGPPQNHPFDINTHTAIRNKHASQVILEAHYTCVGAGYDNGGRQTCWNWVHKVLTNFPKCEVVVVILVANTVFPETVITEFSHLRFVFRAVGKEGCPESWRALAERNKNVSIEYAGKG